MTCAAGADAHTTVAEHFYAALKTGQFTVDELDEFVLHFALYCGWPKAEVVETILDRQLTRLADEGAAVAPRRCPQPLSAAPADQERRKQGGEQCFREVNCYGPPPRGVPYYDGILTFVFGELWQRPGLNRRDRRWITWASAGLDDTIVPIQSHVYSAMKSGDITYDEMREMVLQFAAHSGWPKAQYMQHTTTNKRKDEDDHDILTFTGAGERLRFEIAAAERDIERLGQSGSVGELSKVRAPLCSTTQFGTHHQRRELRELMAEMGRQSILDVATPKDRSGLKRRNSRPMPARHLPARLGLTRIFVPCGWFPSALMPPGVERASPAVLETGLARTAPGADRRRQQTD